MKEIYSSEPNKAKLITAIQGQPTTPQSKSGSIRVTNDKVTYTNPVPIVFMQLDNGDFEYIIPQDLVNGYRFAEVTIEYTLPYYGTFKKVNTYEITRRLFDFDEINDVLGEDLAIEYNVFTEAEVNVRKIIESHCKQRFDSWIGTQKVAGKDNNLMLPEHMDRLDGVTIVSDIVLNGLSLPMNGYELSETGFQINNDARNKTITFLHQNPRTTNFHITGLWGYSSVPTAVKQAALLLAKGFLCDDIEYRARFILAITNGDTRIQFSPEAYVDSTGNPIVDTLLAPYVRFIYGAV